MYLQAFVFATQISANWTCFEADEEFSLVTTNRQFAQLLHLFFPGFQFSSSLSLFSFSFVLLLLFFFFFYRVALSTRGSMYYISSFFTGSIFGKTSGIICWKSMNEVILLATVFKPGTKTVWLLVNGLSLYYILIINLIDCSLIRKTIQQASVECRMNMLLPAYCDFLLCFCCVFHSTKIQDFLVRNWMERFFTTWQVSRKMYLNLKDGPIV